VRRVFAPEVVQTTAMDCGPAALKCLLEGFGVSASYGRLREACQTDVDGTSIDTLEDIAQQLGLEAEQILLPTDHVLLEEARALPAIAVVRQPSGFTHFVVLWRRHGPLVQVMDPGMGRRWVSRERLLQDLFVHEMSVPLGGFREWTESDDFCRPLDRRMRDLGLGASARKELVEAARKGGWEATARLDAAVRMVAGLVQGGGVRAGGEALRLIGAVTDDPSAIPPTYFTARLAEPDADGEAQVAVRGAVLVRVRGAQAGTPKTGVSPELARALGEPRVRPLGALWQLLRQGGTLVPVLIPFLLALAAVGALLEAVLLRASLDLPRWLGTVQQRLGAAVALVLFMTALRLIDAPLAMATLRIGRQLETRLRQAFLEKLPRLGDRYFQSRPISDMAERAHAVHTVRELPDLGARCVRASLELVATTAAIAWFDPPSARMAIVACALAIVVPLVWQPVLVERDLRVRSHAGALARLTLDALLGLMCVRTHAAETAVRREHESLLVEWARASRSLVRSFAWADAMQSLATLGSVAWLIDRYVMRAHETGGVLLLAYWGLQLPALGDEVALALRQYPGLRNVTLRLLEPLGAAEDPPGSPPVEPARDLGARGVALELRAVRVVAAGHAILEDVNVRIGAGEQVAIVGASGAGKSSLVGVLLGWHRVAAGSVEVDGARLEGAVLDVLRSETAWVDPAVQIWNRSLLDNVRYGAAPGAGDRLARILESAGIQPLLDRLPEGMQTPLGEGGALVSGGEGQRVRLGRAMMRPAARLVIFDEPFRGLDRGRRRAMLARARAWWQGATLICITHDIGETLDFERVLVLDGGRIVEDGQPRRLAEHPGSRYGAMLRSERALLETMWGGPEWRRVRLEGGLLVEGELSTPDEPVVHEASP
jgi:ABC-type bacteriocin/lantibiotic exporter with double-glycine peptidase domain